MTETLATSLLRLSEAGTDEVLIGSEAQPHFGPEFERLLRRGVLREEARLNEWAPCDDCECGAEWRPLDAEGDDRLRARCPLDHSRDVILHDEDVRIFRLDYDALARFLGSAVGGLSGEVEAVAPGIWSLGMLPSRRRIGVCFERYILEQFHLPVLLGPLADPHMTLLGPPAKPQVLTALRSAGIEFVELARAWSSDTAGRFLMNTLLIEPVGRARLVLDASAQRVFVDGTPQHVPGQPYRFLDMLVTATAEGRGPVSKFDIEERLSRRQAKDVARELRNALSRGRPNGDEIRAWIAAVRSGGAFEITLPPDEVDLRA